MSIKSDRIDFDNRDGIRLAARLDHQRAGQRRGVALFAHCFSCSKDFFASNCVSRALAERGFHVLRFDFTGLGQSGGEFANSNFTSNVHDIVDAAQFLAARGMPVDLMVGHSLGGAAVLAAASQLPEIKAIATIGAPADPEHVTDNFSANLEEITRNGEATVSLGGRAFKIKKQFLDDLAEQAQPAKIAALKRPLLVLHAPLDQIVSIDNATEIFKAARHPKSFVSLDDADHLLSTPADADFAATVIASWAERYVPLPDPEHVQPEGDVLVDETGRGRFQQDVVIGPHLLLADEPTSFGGDASGPAPYDLLLAGLGACTAMTIRMYAERKALPLVDVRVHLSHSKVHAQDCASCETKDGKVDVIERQVELVGPDLSEADRTKLLEIADKCPVHRTLHSEVQIKTALKSAT